MQVIRFRAIKLFGEVRTLYSAAALGLDGFLQTKARIKTHFNELEDKFKTKMQDFTDESSKNMIFTEDLKHMIHLTEDTTEDLTLLRLMMTKFAKQNKDMRFGSFVFGPVVMRLYHHLNKPTEALEVFKALEEDGFFDQLVSYQVLMDLLLKNEMYAEVLEVFEIVKRKQLKGSKYPKNAVVLALAACYKMSSPESYRYAKELWKELTESGHYPMRRAGTFAAALAILQGEPHVGLEILTSIKQQAYVTVRNLKVWALSELDRPDDALPLLRAALETDRPHEKKSSFSEDIISKLRSAIEKFNRPEVCEEFERLERELRNGGHISGTPISDLLCAEITVVPMESMSRPTNRYFKKRNPSYSQRPGLEDMI